MYATLIKDFTINGTTIAKGTRFYLYLGNMFEDGVGFNRNGTFYKPNYFGYGKYLYIPAEYFKRETIVKYLEKTFGMERKEIEKNLDK